LKALLHILAHGHFLGKGINDPQIRRMFERDTLLASNWYLERLEVKQSRDIALWRRHIAALERFQASDGRLPSDDPRELDQRLSFALAQMARVSAAAYRQELIGTIGADPFYGQIRD
jgi:hypothetical protein